MDLIKSEESEIKVLGSVSIVINSAILYFQKDCHWRQFGGIWHLIRKLQLRSMVARVSLSPFSSPFDIKSNLLEDVIVKQM